MHADDTIYTRVRNGVVVVSGTGPAIRIDGGRLVIRDGPKDTPPLCLTRAEAHRRLRHVIVCGDAGGYVSFPALRWLRDTGVAFSHLDWDGTVIAASPSIPDQPALRRAQALVCSGAVPQAVAAITRQILSVKLQGQARVARLLAPERPARAIERLAGAVARESDVAEILVAEAQGAALYWSLWNDMPVRFARQNPDRLGEGGRWQPGRRDPWLTFGPRASLLTNRAYRATTPGNAILNWLYAVCEIELTIALQTAGLDPGVGLFHVDMVNRASLTLDAIEALRPYVDHWLAGYLASTVFANRDFTELPDGEVRMTHPLNAHLAHTATLWRRLAEPVAGWLAGAFLRVVYPPPRASRENGSRIIGQQCLPYESLGRLRASRHDGKQGFGGSRTHGGPVLRLEPLTPLLPAIEPHRNTTPLAEARRNRGAGEAGEEHSPDRKEGFGWRPGTVVPACRECGRALPDGRRTFCSGSCSAKNRPARSLPLMLSPDQAPLRAAIIDRGLTFTDVANACGIRRGTVAQWFVTGPHGRPIPARHMATIRMLLEGPK